MAKRNWPGKTASQQALNCIGQRLYEAMYLDGDVDFTVSSRKLPDGTMVVSVLHPRGTSQFTVSADERKAEADRLRGMFGTS